MIVEECGDGAHEKGREYVSNGNGGCVAVMKVVLLVVVMVVVPELEPLSSGDSTGTLSGFLTFICSNLNNPTFTLCDTA